MSTNTVIFRKLFLFSIPILLLYLISIHNYLLFHSIVEIFAIVIAASVFIIAWNTYYDLRNNFYRMIGISYFFVIIFDLFHTFSYKGINILNTTGADLPTQLWIIARYFEVIGLAAGLLFAKNVYNKYKVFLYFGIPAFSVFMLLLYDRFPACYIEGSGLTMFKILSEYAIILFIIAVLIYLWKNDRIIPKNTKIYFSYALIFTALAELFFTFYIGVYDLSNLLGHLCKAFSFYMVYLAFIKTTYDEPFNILERQKRQLEKKYRSLFESGSDAVFVHGVDFRKYAPTNFYDVNEEGCKLLGYKKDELKNLSPRDIQDSPSDPEVENIFNDLMNTKSLLFQTVLRTKNMNVIPVEIKSKVFNIEDEVIIYSSVRDIRNRQEKEREKIHNEKLLAQQSKLSLLGEMIGAIAHQWKQPLNSIAITVQYIQHIDLNRKESQDETKKISKQILDNIKFLTDTIDNFRGFVKPKTYSEEFSIINSLIETCRIYSPQLNKDNIYVDIYCSIPDKPENLPPEIVSDNISVYGCENPKHKKCSIDISKFYGSENEFKNVVVNLIANARDAILSKENFEYGKIVFNLYEKDDNVFLSVEDNGGGVPEEIKDQIFQKYFTTKAKTGTGIGLSVIKDIVEQVFKGQIIFENTSKGAKFIISVPANKTPKNTY